MKQAAKTLALLALLALTLLSGCSSMLPLEAKESLQTLQDLTCKDSKSCALWTADQILLHKMK